MGLIEIDTFIEGAKNVFLIGNLLWLCIGVIWGVIAGAIPGITSAMAMIIVLPLSYTLSPMESMILMCSCYAGSIYGGSITSILLNAPGNPGSACTALDGYPLSKKGFSNEALGLAVSASALGGLFSYFVLLFGMNIVSRFALRFGPPELFMVTIVGISVIASTQGKSVVKGLLSGFLGLFLGTVGMATTGGIRGTFLNPNLMEGLPFLPVLIGFFAFNEAIYLTQRPYVYSILTGKKRQIFSLKRFYEGMLIVFKYPINVIRSSIIGTIIGAIPATGADLASFIAYNQAQQFSSHPETFGKGEYEGITASETSNNASTGGAILTTLTLGIPGSTSTAVLLGALMLQGLIPGPRLFMEQMPLVYTIIVSLFLSQLVMIIVGTGSSYLFTLVVSFPTKILAPIIGFMCVLGAYAVRNSVFDIYIMLIASVIGILMRSYGYPLIGFVVGLVLGPIADEQFILTYIVYKGNFTVFFTRPLSLCIFIIVVITLLLPFYISKKKDRVRKDT